MTKGRSENFESTVSETNTSLVNHNDIAGIKTRVGAISCIETYRSNTSVRNVARWVDATIGTQSALWQTSHDCGLWSQLAEPKHESTACRAKNATMMHNKLEAQSTVD